MTPKLLLPLAGCLLVSAPVLAQQVDEAKAPSTLKANFRRIAVELSSTDVSHAKEYADSPITQLSTDSQTVVKGTFDFALEYNRDNLRWTNGLFAEYAKTKLKPADGPSTDNEDADKILFSSDYAHKVWRVSDLDLGPMFNGEYQTEFTKNDDAPRLSVLRAKAGIMLFNGEILKDLYIAGVGEYDMTYSQNVSKTAGEIGWRLEYELREGVKLSTNGYYRDYFSYSHYVGTDLEYDLDVKARMDVALWGNFALGPYVSYRQAKSREADVSGSNFQVGLSLSYNNLFDIL